MNSYLKKFCEFEKRTIEIRSKLIKSFEEAVAEVDTDADLSSFITASKAPELTHKYSKVLEFLDWNFDQQL